jgi:hypothetical protein
MSLYNGSPPNVLTDWLNVSYNVTNTSSSSER